MKPLTLDDLLPLEDYAGRRREFFEAHQRYLDRHRRVRVGPRLTLVFENRQTLWFRVQEVLRVARLTEPAGVQSELNLYNRLLPTPSRLQASLLIDVDESRLNEELLPWRSLRGDELRLHLGDVSLPADLLTARPEDRCVGAAHWLQWPVPLAVRPLLLDLDRPAFFTAAAPAYRHESPPLSEYVRQSLYDDLRE